MAEVMKDQVAKVLDINTKNIDAAKVLDINTKNIDATKSVPILDEKKEYSEGEIFKILDITKQDLEGFTYKDGQIRFPKEKMPIYLRIMKNYILNINSEAVTGKDKATTYRKKQVEKNKDLLKEGKVLVLDNQAALTGSEININVVSGKVIDTKISEGAGFEIKNEKGNIDGRLVIGFSTAANTEYTYIKIEGKNEAKTIYDPIGAQLLRILSQNG